MIKYIKALFAIAFVVFCYSCNADRTLVSGLEVPTTDQEQQAINGNSNLDKFVDEVKFYPEDATTQAEKDAFYNDDSTSTSDQK